jgi:hypothetical protein
MALAINSRDETLPNSLIKGVKIGKDELNSICGRVHSEPEVFDESKPSCESRRTGAGSCR